MKQVYFATTNEGKFYSLSLSLKKHNIDLVHSDIELPEPRTDNLREIAKSKIWFAYNHLHRPCVAVDAGFYIDSLNGFPGSYVNYALDKIGIEGILKLVDGKFRECEFSNCLAYMDETMADPIFFESQVRGHIAVEPRGEKKDYHWSELFFIFEPEGRRKTLAEMTDEEYNMWRKEREKDSCFTSFARWFVN